MIIYRNQRSRNCRFRRRFESGHDTCVPFEMRSSAEYREIRQSIDAALSDAGLYAICYEGSNRRAPKGYTGLTCVISKIDTQDKWVMAMDIIDDVLRPFGLMLEDVSVPSRFNLQDNRPKYAVASGEWYCDDVSPDYGYMGDLIMLRQKIVCIDTK